MATAKIQPKFDPAKAVQHRQATLLGYQKTVVTSHIANQDNLSYPIVKAPNQNKSSYENWYRVKMGIALVRRLGTWRDSTGGYQTRKVHWEEYAWAATETWLVNNSGILNKPEKVVLGTFYIKSAPNQVVTVEQEAHRNDLPSLGAKPELTDEVFAKFHSIALQMLLKAQDAMSPKGFLKTEIVKAGSKSNKVITASFDSAANWVKSVPAP
jgi:hypothetical protein